MDEARDGAELERLLQAAAGDPAERPAFFDALLGHDVLVLGTLEPPPTDGVAQPGSSMQLVNVSDDEGALVPFFTSHEMLQVALAARPGTDPRFLRVPCRALFEMTKGSRLVLNPDAPYGKIFLPAEIDALVAGREPGMTTDVVTEARQVTVGAAAHIPDDLPPALSRFFVQRPSVQAAHLGWVAHPDGQTGYLMIVVAPDREEALHGLGTLAISELTEGQTLDVMVVTPHETDHLLAMVPAFYVRRAQADLPPDRKRRWFGRS